MGDKKKAEKADKQARQAAKAASRSEPAETTRPSKSADQTRLPKTRAELMDLHRETRARRNAAPHGSGEHVAAIDLIGRIEVEIARIERAMDPPVG
jgi:hypothetical protein